MLLYSTWIGQTLPLWLNDSYSKTWEETQGQLFLPYFCQCQKHALLDCPRMVWADQAIMKQNWSEDSKLLKQCFYTSFAHMMSISVYLLRWVLICNNVYISHRWCEGNTVNISSTSGSVFEVLWNSVPTFLFLDFYWKMTNAVFFTSLDNRDLKSIFVATSGRVKICIIFT